MSSINGRGITAICIVEILMLEFIHIKVENVNCLAFGSSILSKYSIMFKSCLSSKYVSACYDSAHKRWNILIQWKNADAYFQISPVMILIALDQSVSDCYLSSTHLAEKNSAWDFQRGLGGWSTQPCFSLCWWRPFLLNANWVTLLYSHTLAMSSVWADAFARLDTKTRPFLSKAIIFINFIYPWYTRKKVIGLFTIYCLANVFPLWKAKCHCNWCLSLEKLPICRQISIKKVQN